MTRSVKLSVLAAFAFTTACASENPTAPMFDGGIAAAKSANKQVTRPAGGSCTTNIHSAVPTPTALILDMTGQCNLKHLGRTTIVTHQVCSFIDGSCANSTTSTAANGDILYSTWYSAPGQNTFDGLHAVFAGTETYAGGTGRFEGATGSSFASGTATLDPVTGGFTGQFKTKGTITF